jgi:hypothetical protein
MSLWTYKKDKSGKKILWQIDYDPMTFVFIVGLLAAIVGPELIRNPSIIIFFPFMILLAGLTCLIISKISIYKKGIWFSFGIAQMTEGYAKLYKVGYLLFGVSSLLLLALFNAFRGT